MVVCPKAQSIRSCRMLWLNSFTKILVIASWLNVHFVQIHRCFWKYCAHVNYFGISKFENDKFLSAKWKAYTTDCKPSKEYFEATIRWHVQIYLHTCSSQYDSVSMSRTKETMDTGTHTHAAHTVYRTPYTVHHTPYTRVHRNCFRQNHK